MSARDSMLDLLERTYASFANGDTTVWTQVTDDVIGIGSDPDEWWEGRSRFVEVVSAQVQEMASAGLRLTAGSPRIFERGEVLWAVDHPTLHMPDGSEVPMRVTMIAVSENGDLKIAHGHYSVGAANEEVFQQELTT